MVHLIIQQQALPKSTKTTSKNIHSPQSPTFSAVNFTLFSISMILFTTVHLCNSGGGPAAVSSIEPSSASSPSSSSSVVQPLNNNLWFSENKKEENADSIRTTASSSRRGQLKRRRELRSGGVFCENNGTLVNGRCECRYPHTGSRCADFACEHGLSVGPRYDPESLFFNRKCICDEDWAGELCNTPIADQCNGRGQYKNGRCKCHGYYFGPKCQYVGKCENGKLQEGKCICSYGFEGDYCDKIQCHHGYTDKNNHSESCICPPRHTGPFCDECLLTGPYVLPYPNCTEEKVPHWARLSREKTTSQTLSRLLILAATILLLALFALTMTIMRWGKHRALSIDRHEAIQLRRKMTEEQKDALKRKAWQSASRHQSRVSTRFVEIGENLMQRFRAGCRFHSSDDPNSNQSDTNNQNHITW